MRGGDCEERERWGRKVGRRDGLGDLERGGVDRGGRQGRSERVETEETDFRSEVEEDKRRRRRRKEDNCTECLTTTTKDVYDDTQTDRE